MQRPTRSTWYVQAVFYRFERSLEANANPVEQRFISVALFYVQETARKDQPNGFVPNPAEPLMLAEAEGWNRHVQQVKELQSGFHKYVRLQAKAL